MVSLKSSDVSSRSRSLIRALLVSSSITPGHAAPFTNWLQARDVIKSFPSVKLTAYYDNHWRTNGDPCASQFGQAWNEGPLAAKNATTCQWDLPPDAAPGLTSLGTNQVVAVDNTLLATPEGRLAFCGKRVRVTRPDGEVVDSTEDGPLVLWDGCQACAESGGGIVDFAGLTDLPPGQCGSIPGFKVEILSEQVWEPVKNGQWSGPNNLAGGGGGGSNSPAPSSSDPAKPELNDAPSPAGPDPAVPPPADPNTPPPPPPPPSNNPADPAPADTPANPDTPPADQPPAAPPADQVPPTPPAGGPAEQPPTPTAPEAPSVPDAQPSIRPGDYDPEVYGEKAYWKGPA